MTGKREWWRIDHKKKKKQCCQAKNQRPRFRNWSKRNPFFWRFKIHNFKDNLYRPVNRLTLYYFMKKYLYCIASVPFFSLEAIKNNPELTAAFVQMLTERRNSFQDTLRDSYPNLMALEDTSLVRLLLEAEFPIRVGGRLSSAWTWCESTTVWRWCES